MGICDGQLLQVSNKCHESQPVVVLAVKGLHNCYNQPMSVYGCLIKQQIALKLAAGEMCILCSAVSRALWTPSAKRWQNPRRICVLRRRNLPGSRLVLQHQHSCLLVQGLLSQLRINFDMVCCCGKESQLFNLELRTLLRVVYSLWGQGRNIDFRKRLFL